MLGYGGEGEKSVTYLGKRRGISKRREAEGEVVGDRRERERERERGGGGGVEGDAVRRGGGGGGGR